MTNTFWNKKKRFFCTKCFPPFKKCVKRLPAIYNAFKIRVVMPKTQGKVSDNSAAVLKIIIVALQYQSWILGICKYSSCHCQIGKRITHQTMNYACWWIFSIIRRRSRGLTYDMTIWTFYGKKVVFCPRPI